jgi:hypothetical protein
VLDAVESIGFLSDARVLAELVADGRFDPLHAERSVARGERGARRFAALFINSCCGLVCA